MTKIPRMMLAQDEPIKNFQGKSKPGKNQVKPKKVVRQFCRRSK